MSKLEQLFAELCPNGVEYRGFEDLCTFTRGVTYSKAMEVPSSKGCAWKVLRANNITLKTNTLNFDNVKFVDKSVRIRAEQLLIKDDILICAGSGSKEHIGKVAFINEDIDYTFGGFMAVIRCSSELKSRFLFHILASNVFLRYLLGALSTSTINNLSSMVMGAFRIPVPPLPVQQEIVRILDTFTGLTAELTAELTARRKQYEYYRGKLLSLSEGTKHRDLGDICIILDSQRKPVTKKDRRPGKYPYYGANGIQDYVHDYIFEGTFLLVGEDGSVMNKDNSPVVTWASGKLWVNNHAHVLAESPGIMLRFLYFYLQTSDVSSYVQGVPPKLNQKSLRRIKIALPPLAEQERIVSILDKFDALCNDLTSGLPAEIEARRKQYEYYRDKLLTFKEVGS